MIIRNELGTVLFLTVPPINFEYLIFLWYFFHVLQDNIFFGNVFRVYLLFQIVLFLYKCYYLSYNVVKIKLWDLPRIEAKLRNIYHQGTARHHFQSYLVGRMYVAYEICEKDRFHAILEQTKQLWPPEINI